MTQKSKILVVDDSIIVLEHARLMFEAAGHLVMTCDDPLKAERDVLTEKPDVVLVDVDMPKIDGPQLIAALRSQIDSHGARLVYFSDSPEDVLMNLTVSTGADGYICKSWSEKELLQYIEDQLRQKRAAQP